MYNIRLSVEEKTLIIRVNLSEEMGPSASGKSILIASTQGSARVPGHPDLRVGVNVYRVQPQ